VNAALDVLFTLAIYVAWVGVILGAVVAFAFFVFLYDEWADAPFRGPRQ
jgi:hypothetical protein